MTALEAKVLLLLGRLHQLRFPDNVVWDHGAKMYTYRTAVIDELMPAIGELLNAYQAKFESGQSDEQTKKIEWRDTRCGL